MPHGAVILEEILGSFLQNQRRILGTKADAVAQRMLDAGFSPNIRNIVEIAIRIRLVQVDGRGNLAVFHCNQCCCDARSAACALSMADLRLQSRHWDLVSMIAESQL